MTDPTHDNGPQFDPHGDIVGASADYLNGLATVSVTVATWDNPQASAWEEFGSGPVWGIDTTGDQTPEFVVSMFNDGNHETIADISTFPGGVLTCVAPATTDPLAKSYSVTFGTAGCIGSPSFFKAQAVFFYSTSTSTLSTDEAAWTSPVSDVAELPPSPPTNVHATAANGSATVTWTAAATNGSSVTGYTISTVEGSPVTPTVGSATHAVTMTGLTNGRTYTFEVIANSSSGSSLPSAPSNPVVPKAPTPPPPPPPPHARSGYWMLGADGHVYAFGNATNFGSAAAPAVAIATRRDGNGYWIVNASGAVSAFGSAGYHGGTPQLRAGEVVSTISATPSGNGYWLFSNRGRVFAYGDAHSYGDMSSVTLNGPIVASVATSSGHGYYMIGSDGGVFSFGDARFHGSTGNIHLNKPVVGISPTPANSGYWLVASDGGVFAFDAAFRGSMGSTHLNQPVNGLVAYGTGYLMVASDGGIFDFSNKAFVGSLGNNPPSAPVIGVAAFTS